MKKFLKNMLFFILIFLLFLTFYFFVGKAPQVEKINWGVNFSQKHAQNLELDWKETYLALLDELKFKKIKLAFHWDLIEPESGEYNFNDLDWQIDTAKEKGAEILLIIGMKTSRWPECHIPKWAKKFKKEEQQKAILKIIEEIVLRYNQEPTIFAWQVENEPFFPFGECPWIDKKFLKEEVKLVKSLDGLKRPILISDSGEWSFWIEAARLGDIVGTTLYKKVWFHQLGRYVNYHFPAVFYWRKAKIIKTLFNKEVIDVELQAEPWCPTLLYYCPLKEQEKTMNLEQFRKNVEFAKKTGFETIYLWGGEWWYWLKEKQNQSEIWQEAKKLFSQ